MIPRKTIIHRIKRLEHNSTIKRTYLLNRASVATRLRKRLTLASGILAILSACAITSVLVKIFNGNYIQIIAAISSALSGTITVFLTTQKDEEIKSMFDGSTDYLSLREQCSLLTLDPKTTAQTLYDHLISLKASYTVCDSKYSKFINYKSIMYDYDFDAVIRPKETWLDKVFPRSIAYRRAKRLTWRNKIRSRIDSISNNRG